MNPNTIYGRGAEIEQLRQLLSRRRSFLIHGSSGVGKTLLLRHVAGELPEILYCRESSSSLTVFRALTVELFAKNNRCVVKACGRSGLNAVWDKSAVSLRGIVTDALGDSKYWLVLDHVKSPSQSFAATVKELCGRAETPFIAATRSAHMEDVGFLLPLFSDRPQKFALRNFSSDVAKDFALWVATEMQLEAVNRDEAINQIVRYSKGNPGAIIAMLQMAISPRYVVRQHIKLSPLYIDFRLSWGAIHE